jgi:hypothetical protein
MAHAIDGVAFLIAGQQDRQRAGMVGMGGNELLGGHHERSHAALHVGRATAVEHAVADLRDERVAAPCLARAGRHHVGMAKQHQHRRAAAMRGPEVVDLAQPHVFAGKAGSLQALANQGLATGIVGGHRRTGNEFTGEVEDVAHGVSI